MNTNRIAAAFCNLFGITNRVSFMLLLLGALILVFVLKDGFLFLEYYVQTRFMCNGRLRTQQKLKRQSVVADGSASSASKKASRLKQAKGSNPNPLMQAYEMPAPVVKDASRLLPLSLAPTHCYDLMTQAGTLITLVP